MVALACCCGSLAAQNFSLQLADTDPLGIDAFVPGLDELGVGGASGIKGDLDYGLELDTEYNSNFRLTETNEESEFSIFFTPWIRYNSDPEGGAKVKFSAAYRPVVRRYFDNDQLNDVNQNGELNLRLVGSRTEVNLFTRFYELTGTDRLTGSFVDGSLITSGIRASRQIASRTSLNAGWSYGVSDYDSPGLEGSELYSMYFGGYWQASERLSIGPALRYSITESDSAGTRDAWGLLTNIRYQLGNRLWITAGVGPEYASFSGNGNDDSSLNLSADLKAVYLIDARWTWANTIRTAIVPSPTDTNYIVNDYGFQTALYRNLTRGFAYGGIEIHLSDYQDVGTTTTTRDDDLNYTAFLGYRHPLFTERVQLDGRISYGINDGDVDWQQLLVTLGLQMEF